MPKLRIEDAEAVFVPPTARKLCPSKKVSALAAHATDDQNSMLSGQKRLRTDRQHVAAVVQQKRTNLEDFSVSSDLCVASFSRHVDLLEPLIERSVVAAMRSMPQEEQPNSPEQVPQPSNICGNMRPYQILGLNWLIQQHKKINWKHLG